MNGALRRWQTVTTVAILALSIASSLFGLVRPGHYADAAGLLARTRAEDLVVLVAFVPVLAIGLWSARRGSLRGRIVWLGSLAFASYLWASRAVSLAFNPFFVGYVVLLALSAFTLVGGLLDTDADGLRRAIGGRLPSRAYAAVIGIIAVGLASLWLSDVVPASLAGTTPAIVEAFGPRALGTVAIDLGLVVPSLAIAAVWLWREHRWGYVAAGTLLVFGALLAPSLAAITAVDLVSGVSMTPGLVVGTILPPLVAAGFAAWFLRSIPPHDQST